MEVNWTTDRFFCFSSLTAFLYRSHSSPCLCLIILVSFTISIKNKWPTPGVGHDRGNHRLVRRGDGVRKNPDYSTDPPPGFVWEGECVSFMFTLYLSPCSRMFCSTRFAISTARGVASLRRPCMAFFSVQADGFDSISTCFRSW